MHTVSINIKNKETIIEINENETIFDAADRQGVELPHGCLSGSCGACRVFVLEGDENFKDPSYVEQNTIENIKDHMKLNSSNDKERKIRLTCRAKVLGNVKIEVL